ILVEQAMRLNSMTSALFVFGNRRRDRVKILGWGGNGFWLLVDFHRVLTHRFHLNLTHPETA
ncbi:IS66 family insertion sequence element accessory protein TnpB, partial [Burkholderia glumae]|uniref:IS66 family insertion sequence element accessory protein TnpB n=1 Tax=Burkholderia glumae TaxID=337 RepID=UPI0018AF6294